MAAAEHFNPFFLWGSSLQNSRVLSHSCQWANHRVWPYTGFTADDCSVEDSSENKEEKETSTPLTCKIPKLQQSATPQSTYSKSYRPIAAEETKKVLHSYVPSEVDVMEYLGTYSTVLTDIFTLKFHWLKKWKATNQLRADWYFPTHGVLLCTQANNSHLHSDHHLVAKSLKDNTVGLPHLVIMEDMMPLHIRNTLSKRIFPSHICQNQFLLPSK